MSLEGNIPTNPTEVSDLLVRRITDQTEQFSNYPQIAHYLPAVYDLADECIVPTLTTKYPAIYSEVKGLVTTAVAERETKGNYADAIQLLSVAEDTLDQMTDSGNVPEAEVERARIVVNCQKGLTYTLSGEYSAAEGVLSEALSASILFGSLPGIAEAQRHRGFLERKAERSPYMAVPYSIEGREVALFLGRGDQAWFDGGLVAALYDSRIKNPILLNVLWSQTKSLIPQLNNPNRHARNAWVRGWLKSVSMIGRTYLR